jgi:hypothetical protein
VPYQLHCSPLPPLELELEDELDDELEDELLEDELLLEEELELPPPMLTL